MKIKCGFTIKLLAFLIVEILLESSFSTTKKNDFPHVKKKLIFLHPWHLPVLFRGGIMLCRTFRSGWINKI